LWSKCPPEETGQAVHNRRFYPYDAAMQGVGCVTQADERLILKKVWLEDHEQFTTTSCSRLCHPARRAMRA
jgi:hypothetical protein